MVVLLTGLPDAPYQELNGNIVRVDYNAALYMSDKADLMALCDI
jgi:hypothetical protein